MEPEEILRKNKLDILKVKQKVFNSYPANSAARKNLVLEEKKRDLQTLSDPLSSSVIDLALTVGHQSIVFFLKKLVLYSIGIIAFFLLSLFFASTIIEYTFFSLFIGFFGYKFFKYIFSLFLQVQSLLKLKREAKKIQDEKDKLKKDLFGV